MPDWELEDGQDEDREGENKSFKDLRNYSRKLEREAKAAATELEELRAFRAQVVEEKRESALGSAFKEVGLSPTHAKLFKALNPEIEVESITPETVFNFAKEYELVAAEQPAPDTSTTTESNEGFTPVSFGAPAPLKTYTIEEIRDLRKQGNLEEVNRAVKEGRVEKESVPWSTGS